MGRGKLTMELISREKSRIITFQKRKRGLMKKVYEFSTLCGGDTCMIIYGPKHGDRQPELDTWPEDRVGVDRVINRYKTDSRLKPARGALDLSDFFIDRNKRVEVEIKRLRKNIFKAKYPTWDDRIEILTKDQLRLLLDVMDAKIEGVGLRINMMKGNHDQHMMEKAMIGKATSGMVGRHGPQPEFIRNHFNSMPALYQDQLSNFPMKSLDTQWTSQFQTDQGSHILPFDPSPMDNSFMKLLHGDHDWTQFETTSTGIIHAPLNDQPSNYNIMSGDLENTISNNPNASMNYYDPTRQFTPQYMQYPMMPNISPQMHSFQVNDLCDINEFDMKKKRLI